MIPSLVPSLLSKRAPGAIAALLCAIAACSAGAQDFKPFGTEDPARYQFNLARNFFTPANAAVEDAALRRQLDALLAAADAFAPSPTALLELLQQEDAANVRLLRYLSYLSLRTLTNSADLDAANAQQAIGARGGEALGRVRARITALDSTQLAAFVRSEPRLRPYWFSLMQYRASRAPGVATDLARANSLQRYASTWGPELFRRTMRELDLGKVRDSAGREYDLRTEGTAIRNHAERAVREAGYRTNNRALDSRRDTFALILTQTAANLNEQARLRGFADYPAQSYGERRLSTADVKGTLEAIARTSATNRRYEALRKANVVRALGLRDAAHTWDLTAPIHTRAPRFTIADARRTVEAAVKPLGAAYEREMRALLDPSNGRLDLVPRPNRVERPGFSTGFVGFPSMFFQGKYDGFTEDLVILAHEAGHAVQNMLMDSAGVLPRYASGPSYFTESFGLFAELLLLDYLARNAEPAQRTFFLERLLDQATDLYRNAWESAVEQAVFDSATAGRVLTAQGIESLTQSTAVRYSSWFGPGSERQLAWVQPLQLYTWPLYRINYVYGKLLALAYFDAYTSDPARFQRNYTALLRGGYHAEPNVLLGATMGLTVSAADLVPRAERTFERWVTQLERAYR